MNEKAVVIPVELETKTFDKQIKETEMQLRVLEQKYKAISEGPSYEYQKRDLRNISLEYEKINNKLVQLKANQDKITKQDLSNIQNDLSGIGDKIGGITKKVGKWALAIFSVRSAYSFVRNAVSRISEQDEELKANIEYMKDVLAYSIEPIIRTIVDWAKQILQYIGYIIKQVTGYNIFENANKRIKETNKSAKELKKTLMGFDEVEILGEQSSLTGKTGVNIDPISLDNVKGIKDLINEWNEVDKATGNTLSAMDNIEKKSKETVDFVVQNWDKLEPKQAEQFFGYLDAEISIAKNQIEGLSKQKDNLWFNPKKQKEIEKQIDSYKEHIRSLTINKYRLLIETKVDSTQLGELMTQISKSSLLNLPKNILSVANKLKSLTGLAKGGIIYPRLARGGIVNYPGRGIMYGGANIAEQGAEAIVPLTDSQQMQLLGKAIADNLSLNATIPIYVGNRQVAREIRKINMEDSFATNGG